MQGIIGLVVLVLAVIAILDIIKSAMPQGKKVLWILLVILLPVIGMVLYFVIGKKKAA